MKWSQESYIKAFRFAAKAHENQKVPGSNFSYIYHISLVTMEIIAVLEKKYNQELAIQSSLLHDTIEDTNIKYGDIMNIFGKDVADGVQALTKDKNIEKINRMHESLSRILKEPPEIHMVKMADRITNLSKPPLTWTKDKIINYRNEAILIYETLKNSHTKLDQRLHLKIEEYSRYII